MLKTTKYLARAVLEVLSDARLTEAELLAKEGHFGTAIYLGGYALECLLKAVICRRLDLDELPATFHSHDLEALLLHSGLHRRMESKSAVHENFRKASDIWMLDNTADSVRYRDPSAFVGQDYENFNKWLCGREAGVIPWLRDQISNM